MKKILYLSILTTLLSGCYASRFPINQANVALNPTSSETKFFLLWGLIPQPKYTDPAQVCGGINNVGIVETKTSFADGLISLLTLGLITPQTANVYCSNYGYQVQYQAAVPSYSNLGYQQPQGQYPYSYGGTGYQNSYAGSNYQRWY